MTSKWMWLLSLATRRLWFRTTLISLLAVVAALLSFAVSPYLPEDLSTKVGADAVEGILNIIASSMLAVTTFSLSAMVAAYSAATNNVTPRATPLLLEDSTTQNVLAAFIGSFLYSLVAMISLSMGAYGERGRVVLFAVTLLVILLVVVTLLRWIDYLQRLGRVGQTTERVEEATARALRKSLETPNLGGHRLADPARGVPEGSHPVFPDSIGYIQHVDVAAVAKAAERSGGRVYLWVLPGTFVDRHRPLAWCSSFDGTTSFDPVRDAFTIGRERNFDQDPRFGLSVMAEIASRALSPAVNDPGTAIDVIGRAVRLLSSWNGTPPDETPRYPQVWVPAISARELFDDIFIPIARDGAAIAEVQIRLQKAFGALSRTGNTDFQAVAHDHSAQALERARAALQFPPDFQRVLTATRSAFS